ncbi:MAG: hypothetical protein AB7L94_31880, partial [Kofleriaceae bacterium]
NQHAIGRDRSMSGYRGNERSMGNNRDDEPGYGGSQYSGYRGTDDRSHRSYGYDDRGFSGGYERHPHDEHERGRWGQDYSDRGGHRYEGGMIDDDDRHRRREAEFQRSGYQSHGMYNRSRSGVYGYQDRDERGRFNDTGEGRNDSYRGDDRYRMDRDDRNRFSSDDSRRYGHPGYGYENRGYDRGGSDRGGSDRGGYDRGGYGRGERRFDEQRGYGGSVASDRFGRDRNDDDTDRRWTGGGYEEDRRGRGRGRY